MGLCDQAKDCETFLPKPYRVYVDMLARGINMDILYLIELILEIRKGV